MRIRSRIPSFFLINKKLNFSDIRLGNVCKWRKARLKISKREILFNIHRPPGTSMYSALRDGTFFRSGGKKDMVNVGFESRLLMGINDGVT